MKYKPEWKGRLVVSSGRVRWDGQLLGRIKAVYREGAKSPGGMVTNTVFVVDEREFASQTEAIEFLIPKEDTGHASEVHHQVDQR